MIEIIQGLPIGTVGFTFIGEIKGFDYDNVLVPEIDQAIHQYDQIKALLIFGSEFKGYTLEAAWDDTSLGLRHWDGFERIAVVTDVPWLRQSIRAIGVLLPYPVRLFNAGEDEKARRWLSESLGTIHLDQQGDVISIEMIGRLDSAVYQRIEDDLANAFSRTDNPRLLLNLREFDGWLGLGALSQHLALIRDYRAIPKRVAVVGAQRWQHAAQRLMARFVNAETRYFDSSVLLEAQEWICMDL